MEDRDSGSLDQKPVLDLIVELHADNVTGSLKLERPPLQKAVYFRDGQILFAASNDPKDQLASILVEEGKLGPDQMQVAQARVSPGNPLAKVLTELGYISQRELADAARIKVERILTDLYTWTEGTYQFATKSLPKGAIDLELSTPRLMLASIRRVQDWDWVLRQLGSLETVLSPASGLEQLIPQVGPDPQAVEVLRLVDGVKTVKQIGAVSALGEFEVCKILAAGIVAGALERSGGATPVISAADDAFVLPTEEPSFDVPTIEASESIGSETLGLPMEPPPPPRSPSVPDAFEPESRDEAIDTPEPYEKTVFESPSPGAGRVFGGSTSDSGVRPRSESASELIIDEPEPDFGPASRTPLRPKGKRGGGGGSFDVKGILKAAAVVLLLGGAGYAVYHFVWPLVGGGGDSASSSTATATPSSAPAARPGAASPPPDQTPAGGARPGGAASPPSGGDPRATAQGAGTPTLPSSGPEPAPATPRPAPTTAPPATSTAAPALSPRPAAPTPAPAPAPAPAPTRSGTGGRTLLANGDLPAAANAFLQELRRSGADKFTIAIGLYCNAANVERIIESASDVNQLYVLPTTVEGRRCYRVVWGLFDSRDAAQSAMPSVPGAVRAGDAASMPLSQFLR